MASSSYHVRSNSLPTRSHPVTLTLESHLDRLRSSQAASSSSVYHKLSSLKELYELVDDLLQLPHTNEEIRGSVEKVLDGSMKVLDVCSITTNIFSEMKESLKELESSLRRRKIGESELTSAIEAYMASRKKLNKAASKCSKNLYKMSCSKDVDSVATVKVLKEVEQVSLTVFESLLASVCETKSRSILSKLLKSNGRVGNEANKIDSELILLKSSKGINVEQVQTVLKGLEAFDTNIKEAEEELECVYRQLLKTRVSILNTINY